MSMGAEYQGALSMLEVAMRDAVKAFAQWHIENWQISREQWIKECREKPPSEKYIDGFNAGVKSVADSLDTFLDEFHP